MCMIFKMHPTGLLLSILLLFLPSYAQTDSGHRIQEFLAPLQGSHIIIRMPEQYFASRKDTDLLLSLTISTVIGNGMPLQIFSNLKRAPADHASRHLQNQVAWLVITGGLEEAEPIRPGAIINSCFSRPIQYEFFGLYRDLVYLISPDDDRQSELRDIYVRSCFTPFYFVVVRWSIAKSDSSVRAVRLVVNWAFDVCYDAGNCRMVQIRNYFDLANEGIFVVVQSLTSARKNFGGELVTVAPALDVHMDWTSWMKLLLVPMRQLHPINRQAFHVGYVLQTLTRAHNLTFKTVPFDFRKDGQSKCDEKTVDSAVSLHCGSAGSCENLALVAFNRFTGFRTIMSSELSPPSPYNLSSLGGATTPLLACMVLSTTAIVGLLLGIRKPALIKLRPTMRVLRILGSFLSAGLSQATSSRLLYILWALPTFFVLIMYSSILQSSTVMPATQVAELSFDEMVNQNFTFTSKECEYIRLAGRLINATVHGLNGVSGQTSTATLPRREIKLGEHIEEAQGFDNESQLGSRLRECSHQNRKAIVAVDVNRRMYEGVMKLIGLNAVEGRESFFSTSHYVSFTLPKAYLFLKTLEQMKASGIFYHFSQIAEDEYNKNWIQTVRLEMQKAAKQGGQVKEGSYSADFSDSVLMETFLLFLYSLIACLSCLTLELAITHFRSIMVIVLAAYLGLRRRLFK